MQLKPKDYIIIVQSVLTIAVTAKSPIDRKTYGPSTTNLFVMDAILTTIMNSPQMTLNVSITMTKEMDVELLSHARFVKKPDPPPECIA